MYLKPHSRADRHHAQLTDFTTLHELWYRRICDILQTRRCTPSESFKQLYTEVQLEVKDIPSSELQNFRLAWNSFARKCYQTSKL